MLIYWRVPFLKLTASLPLNGILIPHIFSRMDIPKWFEMIVHPKKELLSSCSPIGFQGRVIIRRVLQL